MRVLFLTHSYPRVPGDAPGNFLWLLAVALRSEGVEVRVVAPAAEGLPETDTFDGIVVERFRYAPRAWQTLAYTGNMAESVRRSWGSRVALVGYLGAQFAAATRVRRAFEPDVVHAHWWFPGGLVGTWASGLADLPLVTTMHGTDVRLARASGIAQPVFRRVMQQSRIVTTVSEWLASEVRAIAPGIQPVVARMPVSTKVFFPAGARDPNRLLFVGRLNAQKGVHDLLVAVSRTSPATLLDVVGDGVDRDALRREAHELGIGDRVTWHGALPQTDLPVLYRRAAALIVPSTGEGFGLVSVEAQLCETPVIAYRSGGITETIVDGVTGFLVPPGDVTALAEAVGDIIDRPELASEMGRAGRLNAIAMTSPESSARRYAEIYRRAISL